MLMSYHLNIFQTSDRNRKFSLAEILSMLQEVDPTASVIESQTKAKEFGVQNSDVGKLYFSNGMFWSVYESDSQLKHLLNFLEPLELMVVGEEGETYPENTNAQEGLTQNTFEEKDKKTNIRNLLSQRKIGFFIIFLFVVLAWVIN